MITEQIMLLFGCDDQGKRPVTMAQLISTLELAGYHTECGDGTLIIRRQPTL